MNNPYLFIIIAALFFSAWPLIAKFSGLSTGWLALVVSITTSIVAISQISREIPIPKQILFGVIAGICNGLGTLAYAKLLGWKGVEVSRFIPITLVLICAFTVIGGLIFFKEPITLKKVAGLLAAGITLYLLS